MACSRCKAAQPAVAADGLLGLRSGSPQLNVKYVSRTRLRAEKIYGNLACVASPRLEEVFKTSGVPSHTFVEPGEYASLLLNLRTPGRGLVIEGPSGIGKTTAVETAIASAGLTGSVTKLSARKPKDVEYIQALPDLGAVGVVIVDDFHKLPSATRSALADYLKTLADEEVTHTKVIVIGINRAGENLISFAHDLVNRLDIISFETNSDEKIELLLSKGEAALNVTLSVKTEIVQAAQGSFYLAQMLASEVLKFVGITERAEANHRTTVSFESVRSSVWDRLSLVFRPRCERFCRGNRMKREGRAPYLHILKWLAEGENWTLQLRSAMRSHQELRGSVGQVVEKGFLANLIASDPELSAALHFDGDSDQLTVEDPQFIFFIRNIPWRKFAADVGFITIDFGYRYDFALSFAGEDRRLADALFEELQESEVEVFYDRNEQHRILAADVEEYLRPIYQSEARFVVALLGPSYPKKVWTKFESEAFRERLGKDSVIPIWFRNAQPGMFDETRKYGGLEFDPAGELAPQVTQIAKTIVDKLRMSRAG